MDKNKNSLLFVYGTLLKGLRRGHGIHFGKRTRFIGPATVKGRLIDLGEYPALVKTSANDGVVVGELYDIIDQDLWNIIDDYEGIHDPNPEYRREKIYATINGQRKQVHAYLYARSDYSSYSVIDFPSFAEYAKNAKRQRLSV